MTSNEQILKHLSRLVEFYPESAKQKNVLRLLEYCKEILISTGGFAKLEIVELGGVYTLIASTKLTKTPKVLLQGHVDVVPAEPHMQEVKLQGDKLEGRGVFDMLFATACYLHFAQEHASELPQLNIGIMLSGDEELGGHNSVKRLLEDGYGADVCILPDAGAGLDELNVSGKGIFNFDLMVNGVAHHGSRPWEGDGAAGKLVNLLKEMSEAFDTSSQDNSTMTVTKLSAGDSINKGPAEASAHIDIRTKDKKDYDRLHELIAELCAKYDAKLANVLEDSGYELNLTYPLVKQFVSICEKHIGKSLVHKKAHGSSDARFFAAKNIPVIMFRPEGGGAHGDSEHLSVKSLGEFYNVIEEYILKTATIK